MKIRNDWGWGQTIMFIVLLLLSMLFIDKCIYNDTPSSSNYIHDDSDTAYWNSVRKENALRDAGHEGAANMEENARREYNHGGGYHDKNGNRQVDFQGSREQKEQLDEMDRRGW